MRCRFKKKKTMALFNFKFPRNLAQGIEKNTFFGKENKNVNKTAEHQMRLIFG